MRQSIRREEVRRVGIQDSQETLDLRKGDGPLFPDPPLCPESCDIQTDSEGERTGFHWAVDEDIVP